MFTGMKTETFQKGEGNVMKQYIQKQCIEATFRGVQEFHKISLTRNKQNRKLGDAAISLFDNVEICYCSVRITFVKNN